jgi:hypothetical protein
VNWSPRIFTNSGGRGVAVRVGVNVAVDVAVDVGVRVMVGVNVGVDVNVAVAVGVTVGIGTGAQEETMAPLAIVAISLRKSRLVSIMNRGQ